MDDLSPSKISLEQVHKIVILDIRIMNTDRNSANLLVRRKPDNSFELVPIDHGYCLRSVCDVAWFDWCWLDCPQLKKPMSEKTKCYVLNLDIDADLELLQENLQIGEKALDYLRMSTKILQAGVMAGLTLYEIAIVCCRNDNAGMLPSRLEILTQQARELTTLAIENEKWGHVAASKALADQLSPQPIHVHNKHIAHLASVAPFISKSVPHTNGHANGYSNGNGKSLANHTFDFDTLDEVPGQISSPSNSAGDSVDSQVEREEWAAEVVAVNLDLNKASRSESVGSSSSDESS